MFVCVYQYLFSLHAANAHTGVVVGLSVPGNSDLSASYRPFSSIIGWTYVIAWTIR